jgi:hypothetical protein
MGLKYLVCTQKLKHDSKQCCGSGSGIEYLFDPWIRDPGWEKVSIWIKQRIGSAVPDHYQNHKDPQHWFKVATCGSFNYPGQNYLCYFRISCETM